MGLSLVEVLVSLSILSMIATFGFVGLGNKSRLNSQDLSQVVAAQLRNTRALAMSRGVPVAFVLPSEEGAKPHSQSFYILSGEDKPKVERVQNLASDFPESILFIGATGRKDEGIWTPEASVNLGSFQLDEWHPSSDHQFIFLPSGACVTNALPFAEGTYQIVVTSGLQYSGAADAGFVLQEAANAKSVLISPEGYVSVVTGAGTASASGLDGWSISPALPHKRTASESSSIELTEVVILPPQPEDLTDSNLSAVIRNNEYLTFDVHATDTAGGPLINKMKAFNSSGTEVGGFSAPETARMEWDPKAKQWRKRWSWTAPPGDSAGEIYTIKASVVNGEGEEVVLASAAQPKVEKRTGGVFLFSHYEEEPHEKYSPVLMNDDGSHARVVAPGHYSAAFSSAGELWALTEDWNTLHHCDRETGKISEDEALDLEQHRPWTFFLTPDGASVVYNSPRNGRHGWVVSRLDGSETKPIVFPEGSESSRDLGLTPSPDGRFLAYTMREIDLTTHLFRSSLLISEWDRDSGILTNTSELFDAEESTFFSHLSFSPNGSELAYVSRSRTGDQYEIGIVTLDGSTAPRVVREVLDPVRGLDWSPNGNELAYMVEHGNEIQVLSGDTLSVQRSISLPSFAQYDELKDSEVYGLSWNK